MSHGARIHREHEHCGGAALATGARPCVQAHALCSSKAVVWVTATGPRLASPDPKPCQVRASLTGPWLQCVGGWVGMGGWSSMTTTIFGAAWSCAYALALMVMAGFIRQKTGHMPLALLATAQPCLTIWLTCKPVMMAFVACRVWLDRNCSPCMLQCVASVCMSRSGCDGWAAHKAPL